MILKIKSNNNHLLDVLNKNPNSELGLYLKEHKNGVIVGNVINKNEYHCVFYDTKHSYTNYEDNQLDFKSHCDPKVSLSILNELFSDLLKGKSEVLNKNISWLNKTIKDIDTEQCQITVDNVFISSNWLRDNEFLLCRYIDGLSIKYKNNNIFEMSITSDTIFGAVNILAIVSFFISITNDDEKLFVDVGLVNKFIRIMGNIKEIPYFVYYLFIKRVLIYKTSLWGEAKPILEKNIYDNLGLKFEFTENNTHNDRINYVSDNIDLENDILDFGCGEFKHLKKLTKVLKTDYYGFDLEDYSAFAEKMGERHPKLNINFTTDIDNIPTNKPLSVIMSEVIEHNSMEKGKEIIEDVVNEFDVKQIIITTPNKTFNKYYKIDDDELRRDDHLFEMSFEEFKNYIQSLNLDKPIKNVIFGKISDIVDGESVSSGVIINF